MKKVVRSSWIAAIAIMLLTCFSQRAQASHYQGSDMTYLAVAPGVYQVTLRLYRDCSGIALGTSETMNIRSLGCNTGRNVALPQVANPPGILPFGNPYCGTQTQSPCTTTGAANYETRTYQNTVTFSNTEKNCANWKMSVRLSARPKTENLVGEAYLYTEAYLNLSDAINNNSPEIALSSVPIPFVCKGQPASFSMNASDSDGDSLSYELTRPLDNENVPVAYKPIATGANITPDYVDPTDNLPKVYNRTIATNCSTQYKNNPFNTTDPRPLQTAIVSNNFPTAYSATYPLPSYAINWASCQTNLPINPAFNLDQQTGTINFTPAVYNGGASADGRDKYAVVVQINEWRKINGVMTKVGHIRRDILVIVNNCTNQVSIGDVPNPAPIYGAVVKSDTVIDVLTCTTTRFMLKFQDLDIADKLDVKINGVGNVPGLVMKPFTNKQNKVNVAFYFTPPSSNVNKNYYLNVVVEDDHCPLKSRQEYTYRLHVTADNRAQPTIGQADRTICLGDSTPVNVQFLRPDSILQAPAAYTYQWTDGNGNLPNGMRPADQNKKDLFVRPTQTTRYYLGITSTLAGCLDTTSVLVRVDKSDLAAVTGTTEQTICNGTSATISIAPALVNGIPAAYTSYKWTPAPGLPAAQLNQQTITVNPTTTTRYFLTATKANTVGCPDTASVLVRVSPRPKVLRFNPEAPTSPYRGNSQVEVMVDNDTQRDFIYEWSQLDENGVATPVQSNRQTLTVSNLTRTTNYSVRIANAINTCDTTVFVTVTVDPYFPNIITPNGDNMNDRLELPNLLPNTSVKIFNRWGGIVKEYGNYDNNKPFDAKGVSDGTYYYLIKAPDGKTTKGWFEIVR